MPCELTQAVFNLNKLGCARQGWSLGADRSFARGSMIAFACLCWLQLIFFYEMHMSGKGLSQMLRRESSSKLSLSVSDLLTDLLIGMTFVAVQAVWTTRRDKRLGIDYDQSMSNSFKESQLGPPPCPRAAVA